MLGTRTKVLAPGEYYFLKGCIICLPEGEYKVVAPSGKRDTNKFCYGRICFLGVNSF